MQPAISVIETMIKGVFCCMVFDGRERRLIFYMIVDAVERFVKLNHQLTTMYEIGNFLYEPKESTDELIVIFFVSKPCATD